MCVDCHYEIIECFGGEQCGTRSVSLDVMTFGEIAIISKLPWIHGIEMKILQSFNGDKIYYFFYCFHIFLLFLCLFHIK